MGTGWEGKQIAISESRGEATMIHGRGDLYVVAKKNIKKHGKRRTQKRGTKDGVLDYDYDEAYKSKEGWGP